MRGIKKVIWGDTDFFINAIKKNSSTIENQYSKSTWVNFYDSFDEFFEVYLSDLRQSQEIPTIFQFSSYYYDSETDKVCSHDEQNWFYKGVRYKVDWETLKEIYTAEHIRLMIMEEYDKERKRFERLKRKFELSENEKAEISRPSIPERVRIEVWRRDEGKCVKCGSRERLEYDHIIPVSKGGSNTARNIELLCEQCNRKKGSQIN